MKSTSGDLCEGCLVRINCEARFTRQQSNWWCVQCHVTSCNASCRQVFNLGLHQRRISAIIKISEKKAHPLWLTVIIMNNWILKFSALFLFAFEIIPFYCSQLILFCVSIIIIITAFFKGGAGFKLVWQIKKAETK